MLYASISILCLLCTLGQVNTLNSSKLPAIVNRSLFVEIVHKINARTELKNMVFYVSPNLKANKQLADLFFHNLWMMLPEVSLVLVVNNTLTMNGLLSKPSLCVIMTTSQQDQIMEVAAKSLKSVRYFRTLFLYFPMEVISEKLFQQIDLIYSWSWKKQFLNTLLITIRNQVYLYDPFPKPKVINITMEWRAMEFFAYKNLNVKGMEIRSPVRYDIPRVFCLRRFPNKRRHNRLSGSSGKIFSAFMNSINATFNDTLILADEFQPFNVLNFVKLVEQKELEISVHSYTNMFNTTMGTSYPIGIIDFCMMVPYRNASPENQFLSRIMHRDTSALLLIAAVYITIGIWLCSPARERDLSLSLMQTICSLIFYAPLRILLLPYARQRFIFVVLFTMGFCFTNLYMSKMTSVLTTAGGQDQIDTIQDLVDAKLTVMMLDYEYDMLLAIHYNEEFLKLAYPVDKATLDLHRESLNTTYAYSVTSDRWDFINLQQAHLRTPIFRMSSICIGPFYHVFPLQTDSYMMQPFKQFIFAVSQSGLLEFWKEEAFDDALFLGYVLIINANREVKALTINFFHSVWFLWVGGMFLALLAFIWELKRIQLLRLYQRWFKN